MVPSQEANGDNLGIIFFDFLHNNCRVYSLESPHEAILTSTHNIRFYDKIRKFPLIFVFLSYRKNFVGTQKRVRISHGKRAIGVRAIEVRLYFTKCRMIWLGIIL